MWQREIMMKINRSVFKDGAQIPSVTARTSAPIRIFNAKHEGHYVFRIPEISLLVKSSGHSYVIFVFPGCSEWGEHRWRCWFLSRRADNPMSNLAHDKQRVEVSREHLSDWHKGNYSSCVGATQNFWTFSFSNHTWWIEWKRAIIWFLVGSLSVVGLCWLMISAASHQKRKLSISV